MPARDPRRAARPTEVGAATHIGASPRRLLLEDRCQGLRLQTAAGLPLTLGIVADGVGGEQAGERAAELTLQAIIEVSRASTLADVPRLLTEAVCEANARVYREGCRVRRRSGMSSTAAIAAISDGRLYAAAAGDSRIYLVRGGKAIRLTRDHTWGEDALRQGRISPEAEARHPRRGDLTRSVGLAPDIEADIRLWMESDDPQGAESAGRAGLPLFNGDAIVVASDGLTKAQPASTAKHFVEEQEVPRLLHGRDAESAARALVAKAVERGTDDNVSVVVLLPDGHHSILSGLRRAKSGAMRILAGVFILGGLVGGVLGWRRFGGAHDGFAPPAGMAVVTSAEGLTEFRTGDSGWANAVPQTLLAAESDVALRTAAAPAHVRLELGDGSMATLGPDSEVSLDGIGGDGRSTTWTLQRGVFLIATPDDSSVTVDVVGPHGTLARLLGSLMGVWVDAASNDVHVDCFHSKCAVVGGPPARQSLLLRSGEHASVDMQGMPLGSEGLRCDLYSFAADWVACPTALPTTLAPVPGMSSPTPFGALFVPPTATTPIEQPGEAPGRRDAKHTPTEAPVPTSPPTSPPTDPPPETEPPPPTDEPDPTDEPPSEEPPEPPESPPLPPEPPPVPE
jgi:serine/threonine protein phosphatase PrpC